MYVFIERYENLEDILKQFFSYAKVVAEAQSQNRFW